MSRARGKESTDTVKTTQRKETKPITVILLSDNVYVVPKDKKKLREEQHMNCWDFSIDDTAIEVKNKLVAAFPIFADKDITFLQATKCGDLFKVKEQVTGDSIFKLTRMGSGCLYVTHPTLHHPPPANNSPTPTVVFCQSLGCLNIKVSSK